MPSRNEILVRTENLRGYFDGSKSLTEEQIWFKREKGAMFVLTKPQGLQGIVFTDGENVSNLLLVSMGNKRDREETERGFIEAYGEPQAKIPPTKTHPQALIWDESRALVALKKAGRAFYDSPDGLRLEK